MIDPLILSGKEVSASFYDSLDQKIKSLRKNNITPGLAVVLVGEDSASQVYVRSKTKTFNKLSLFTKTYRLPSDSSERELLELIDDLNKNNLFHGILVQLPLPNHIDSDKVINRIIPSKDVDGFHPENAGLLSIGKPRFIPCTPKGIMEILKYYKIKLDGKHVVVVGRSNIVGRPISILTSLKGENSNGTTTICHSGTKDIGNHTKAADVVIVALGVPEFLKENISLTVYFGEVVSCLEDLDPKLVSFDACFHDGFAPQRNKEMWSPEVFHYLSILSNDKTTYSTFSSSKIVTEGLKQNDFLAQKNKGFGEPTTNKTK